MEFRPLYQDRITDADGDELARLKTLVDPRRLRSDPAVSRQLAVNELRPSVATFAFSYVAMFEHDVMIGLAETFGAINAENADVCELGLWIDPAHQERTYQGASLHRHLFNHVDEIEKARGRVRYWGWGDLSDPATIAFWEGELGYSLAYDERISRCVLAEVDAAMMDSWIASAAERASAYHLIRAEAPFEDALINYFAQALEAMNDAPLDDLEHEVEVFDADRARQVEALHLATRSNYRAVFAIETATGALAGYTAMRVPTAEPALSKQGDTVTLRAHRNLGIGRWLKADMWQWLRDDRPDVHSLDTGNAESNRAMLNINEAMGFRDILHHGVWHQPTAG